MSTVSLYRRRDPFAEFDALMRSAFGPGGFSFPSSGRDIAFTPAAETLRDGADAVIRLEVPGVGTDDFDVELVAGRLVIRGERRDEREEDTDGRHLREIRYGSFERSFALPAHVTAEDISASYEAGVLNVRVAGVYAGQEPRKIAVSAPARAEVEAKGEANGEEQAESEQA
ncbi:MAG TPA: Hsp20/alpha crystallin family protein [Marmoricola sp.]|nr:Hsp20/alpha crystallin family protein [Marmoricola sp.]